MEAKYYNVLEFEKAKSLTDNNPLEAKIKFEEYLQKYPKDYTAYPKYASVLIKLGEFDEAEKILEYVEKISKEDHEYKNEVRKRNLLIYRIIYVRFKLLSYQERYEELFEFCNSHKKELESMELNSVHFYCQKKLGKLNNDLREENAYLFRQITEYRESDFLEHLKKHLSEYNRNTNNNTSVFVTGFPINKIIEEVKKYIPSDKRINSGFYENTYVFKYTGCGRKESKLTDYFKVICFNNTSDIITIHPSLDCEYLPFVDLNYLLKDSEDVKVKRLSQIEKFNKRYKRN